MKIEFYKIYRSVKSLYCESTLGFHRFNLCLTGYEKYEGMGLNLLYFGVRLKLRDIKKNSGVSDYSV